MAEPPAPGSAPGDVTREAPCDAPGEPVCAPAPRDPEDAAALSAPQGAGHDADVLDLLTHGDLDIEGRLVAASNATLYCTVRHGDRQASCVYKPVAGERPLWDFPTGSLAGREVSAYLVSEAGGWHLVPPTVYRDGPLGPGMCQLWIDLDESVDLVALARSRDNAALRQMAVFDAVVNNADRKIGHLLPDGTGRLYGCDHGVCFNEDYKLRTVLWQWRGRHLPAPAVEALHAVQRALAAGPLRDELSRWLTDAEVEATRQRVDTLLRHRIHPSPPDDWHAVPWPPV